MDISAQFLGRVDFQNAMARLRKAAAAGMMDPKFGTLPYQAAKLAEHCMRLTPPLKGESQGKRRVELDLRKIFHPIDPDELDSKSLKKVVYRSDVVAWRAFASNIKKGPFADTYPVIPNAELHAKSRDNRGRGKKTKMVTLWKQRGELNRLIKKKKANVGQAKSGWVPAMIRFAEIVIPDYIRKHGETQGVYVETPSPDRPSVEFRNTSQWGKYHDQAERVANSALKARTKAMQTYFEKQMELAAQKSGAAVTAA